MKFDNTKNYYPSIIKALKNTRRKELYESKKDAIETTETLLFDSYDVDCVYTINEFFDQELFSLNKMPIYFEMKKKYFEEFVDSGKVSEISENFNVYIKVDNKMFSYEDKWMETTYKIHKKEAL